MSSQAGVYYFDQRPVPDEVVEALVSALGVWNIDAQGEYYDVPGLHMAHAATWIDDVAATERQPHTSASGNTITFDGRLDNREDLLLQLRAHIGRRQTDCALALAAYDTAGVNGLVDLIGDWSIAIWEPSTRNVILASDYAGIRPLYYHANNERVFWSSYLKPLVSLADVTELDELFIAGFLTTGGSPGRTPYRDILSVPAGHGLRFGSGAVKVDAVWKLPVYNRIRYEDEGQYDEQLRALFRQSVRARLRTTHPVCSELSGGQDSSSVVCMASALIADRDATAPRISSVSFGAPGAPDEKFYRVVQQFCRIDSTYVNTEEFPFLSLEYLDGAMPAPWGALFLQLRKYTQQTNSRTYCTGMGGDLVMGNWVDDIEQLAAPLCRGQIAAALREAVAWSKATRLPVHTALWRGLLASLPANWSIPSRYEVVASSVIRERHGDSLTPQFKSKTGLTERDWLWSRRWKEAPPERRKHFRSVARVLAEGRFRPPEQLQHLYHTTPYAHRPLVEFLLAIPADVLCGPGEPRKLMRRAFREFLPSEIVARKSKGSYTGEFLKTVGPAARALLEDPKPLLVAELGFVDCRDVRDRLQRMTLSLSCNEHQLRQIVLLELWLRGRSSQAKGFGGSAKAGHS